MCYIIIRMKSPKKNKRKNGGAIVIRDESKGGSPPLLKLTPAEIQDARAKLLTSGKFEEKIEALKRIVYSNATIQIKTMSLFDAMLDSSVELRREALELSTFFAVQQNTITLLKLVASGTAEQKKYAASTLTPVLGAAGDSERDFSLAYLMSVLKYSDSNDSIRAVFDVLPALSPRVLSNQNVLNFILRQGTAVLFSSIDPLLKPFRGVLRSLFAASSVDITNPVWDQIANVANERVISEIACEIIPYTKDPALERKLFTYLSSLIGKSSGEENHIRELVDVARGNPNPLVEELIRRLPDLKPERMQFTIYSIGWLCDNDSISAPAMERASHQMLNLLKTTPKHIRVMIMESGFLQNPRIPPALKSQIAEDIVCNMHQFKFGRLYDLAETILTKLGQDLIEVCDIIASKTIYKEEQLLLARSISEICSVTTIRPTFEKGLLVLNGLAAGPLKGEPEIICHIGRAFGNDMAPEKPLGDFWKNSMRLLGEVKTSTWASLGLAYSSRNKNIAPAQVLDFALAILELFRCKMPDVSLKEMQEREGKRFHIDPTSAAYSDLLPSVITSLEIVFFGGKLAAGQREAICSTLSDKMRELIEFKEIWAPGTPVQLAEFLSKIIKAEDVDMDVRLHTAHSLLFGCENLSYATILACGLTLEDCEDDRYLTLVDSFTCKLVSLLENPDYQNMEDWQNLLVSLGHLCMNKKILKDKNKDFFTRQRIIDLLIENARASFPMARKLLETLRNCKNTPDQLKLRIGGAIGKK